MIEPTTAIAEIALVSDISGVCSSRDTRRITPRPMNVASTKTNSVGQMLLVMRSTFCRASARPRVQDLPRVRDDRALLDVVVEIELECLVLRERLQERRQVPREQQARVQRHRAPAR